jgi:hypothetical protein
VTVRWMASTYRCAAVSSLYSSMYFMVGQNLLQVMELVPITVAN